MLWLQDTAAFAGPSEWLLVIHPRRRLR